MDFLCPVICILIVAGIVAYIIYQIWKGIDQHNKREQERINALNEKRKGEIDNIRNHINGSKIRCDGYLSSFFSTENKDGSYQETYSWLINEVSYMKNLNGDLLSISKMDESGIIKKYTQLASDFNAFGAKVGRLPFTRMMDISSYGKINKSYWDSIGSMSKQTADAFITRCCGGLSAHDYRKIFTLDIDKVLECVWFYATEKPYSAESFKKAESVFYQLYNTRHVDVTIAELYAMKRVGGEDVLRNHVQDMLKNEYISEELTLIASALMWINAYQAENMILQHMLSTGMQMTEKTQERLHSLTNGGGKAPSGRDVLVGETSMYFDISALTWKEDEYIGLFENLAFQEKTLSYSLAVRDEDKDLFITQGISVPDTNTILKKLIGAFSDEYGTAVTATLRSCLALSGSGEEKMEGILAVSNECKQMGILVHLACIGKKLNIKFYTLFMPGGNNLTDQKQQVLSLYNKLSPSVAMWESSIKDTILMSIQQLLNSTTQNNFTDDDSSENSNEPIF